MEVKDISSLMGGASSILKNLIPQKPQAPNQRADGYALGGTASGSSDGTNTGTAYSGANGAAYGGAWGQAALDASNWAVSTGKATQASNSGKSSGIGAFSPNQVAQMPESPFLQPMAATAERAGSLLNNPQVMIVVGIGLIAYLIFKK